jgi:hypothetical protein
MASPDPQSSVIVSAARAGGATLAGVIRALSAVRSTAKPLHPRGEIVSGTLTRLGLEQPTGVAWLDEPGEEDVLLRWSRAIGVPAPAPDIHGLAVRVDLGQGHGDLLFATTGWAPPTRMLLVPRLSMQRPMTTLLPYATPDGAVVLGVRPGAEVTELYVATPLGAWRRFAELRETGGPGTDEPIRFDPVVNQIPGLRVPRWVSRLREPSYDTARHASHPRVRPSVDTTR